VIKGLQHILTVFYIGQQILFHRQPFIKSFFLRHPTKELPFNIDLSHDVLRNSVSAEVARVDFPAVYTLILIRHTFVGSLANLLTCSG